jgi:hypothetical protein
MNQENMTTSLTEEDKKLLLSELSGRLPYGVKFGTTDIKGIWTLSGILGDYVFPNCNTIEVTRPYLRSLSDLTETERNEFDDLWEQEWGEALDAAIIDDYPDYSPEVERLEIRASFKVIEWLCVHHIDYRGLIEKGLAIRVTPENNPYHE